MLELERNADENPHDAEKQYAFVAELISISPTRVIHRLESRRFAVSDSVIGVYREALERTGRSGYFSEDDLVARITPPYKQSLSFSSPVAEDRELRRGDNQFTPMRGTPQAPLYVSSVKGLFTSVMQGLYWFLSCVLLGSLLFGLYNLQGLSGQAGGFAGSPMAMKEPVPEHSNTTFADVKGCDEAKEELVELVEFLRNPKKFNRLGGTLPKGVLMVGPPGTGKTLLAKAVAGEAEVPFFYASGSDFEEVYVGVGARRLRNLFAAARKKAPCLIFIDEIDAVGGTRNAREGTSTRMTLNQLLVEIDGFKESTNIVVIAATNFPELLDKALVRPGRFDKHVQVPLPDLKGRKEILELYLSRVPRSPMVNSTIIARGTPGSSGADLYNLVNSAAVKAALDGRPHVSMKELEWAKDKVLMGSERKSAVMTEQNRKLTAYHEGGHALMAVHTPHAFPIHKATIVPRGMALGMVHQLPENDVLNYSKAELFAQIDVCMGGRVAEEIIFGPEYITTGASNDLSKATSIARQMVVKYGMSERVGPLEVSEKAKLSAETRRVVDAEVKSILETSYERTRKTLKERETQLHAVAQALLKYETLTADEIKAVMEGKSLDEHRKLGESSSPPASSENAKESETKAAKPKVIPPWRPQKLDK